MASQGTVLQTGLGQPGSEHVQGKQAGRSTLLKKKTKGQAADEVPFHFHWRVGVHRHKGELYIKLPGGRVDAISGEKEELRLAIVEARYLPQMDMGANTSAEDRAAGIGCSCDAFVTVQLGNEKRKTDVVRDKLDPYFGENFVFVITDHTDERAEIERRLTDMTKLHIEVHDWDEGGDFDFVGMCELNMDELYTKDSKGRFEYIDKWIDLCEEDGSPAKIRLDGTPARGSIHVRGAIRGGSQIEVLNRVQGRTWLEPGKLVEAVEKTQRLFQEGDREIIERMIDLVNRRIFEPPHISKKHLTMLDEVGVPLGTTLNRPGRKKLDQTDEPLGLRLKRVIEKKVPLDIISVHDPRDTFYNPMKTHWVARFEAINILGKMSSRGDQRAVTAIMGTVTDENGAVRAKSINVLSKLAEIGDLQVADLLIGRIDDEDPDVHRELVNAFRIIGPKNDERLVVGICEFMESPRDEVRSTAIKCLQAVVRPGYLVAIVEACARLEAPSHSVKMIALAALPLIANKGDRMAIVEVVNRLQHPLPPVRLVALQGLEHVAKKGDQFALAAVGNLMEHPDYEVRQIAAHGIQLLCYPGDIRAIQAVVMRLKIDTDAKCVQEGAKYVSAPTTGNPPGWRDPALPQFGLQKLRGDPIMFEKILTPRREGLMPICRDAAVAYHTPVLPADGGVKTIAQMWWRDKFHGDRVRHRYEWAGPQTAHALGMGNSSRPGTSILLSAGTPSLLRSSRTPGAAASLKAKHTNTGVQAVRLKNGLSDSIAEVEIIGGDTYVDCRVTSPGSRVISPVGILGRASSSRTGRPRTVSLDERVRTAESGTTRSGGIKTREQLIFEKMRDHTKLVLDVIQKGLITDFLAEDNDLDEDDVADCLGYEFPPYNHFFECLTNVLKHNAESYKWWDFRLTFPSPDDNTSSDEDRSFSKIKTLLKFNTANAKDLKEVWRITRQAYRRYATASTGKDPLPEIIPKKVGTLKLTIARAQYLPKVNRFGACDCYVELTVPHKEGKTTKVANKSLNPEWQATFSFEVTDRDFATGRNSADFTNNSQKEELKIEGIKDNDEFEPPEGLVGLYYDQKLTMPVTHTEIRGPDELKFKDVIAHLAKRSRNDIELLNSEQTEPRSRTIFFRVHTSDMLETIQMAGRLSEEELRPGFLESNLLDEFRLDLVESLHLTTAQTLSNVSEPVQMWLKHYQLGGEHISVGKVHLPLVPLLNSLASGSNSQLAGWFEVINADKDGNVIRQTDEHNRPTELYLEVEYNQEPYQFFSDNLPDSSQRAREGLGNAIRSLALETLCKITGPSTKKAITEIILCATIPSPDVYSTVLEALMRVGVPSHTKIVKSVVWLPGTYNVVSASLDGTFKVWNTEYGNLMKTIRNPRGSAMGLVALDIIKDVVITTNSDCSFSLWDLSSGKEIHNQPFAGKQIGNLCIAPQGNMMLLSADDFEEADFERAEKQQLRVWSLCQPPSMEEILESQRIRGEYEKCAQALAACNPGAIPEPPANKKLVFPLIERIVMIGAPADLAVSKVPGGIDEGATKIAKEAVDQLYRMLAGGNDYEYPVWIRSLALRVRRERKKSKIALLDSLTVKDSASCKVLKKPTDILRCVRYHPSHKSTFASSGDDGVVRIWTVRDTVIEGTVERAEVKLHSSFEAHPAPIHSLAFHPNFEGCIITASCTVKLWNYVAKESSYQRVLSLPACAKCATCVDIWAVEKSVSATLVVGNSAGVILTWSLEITPLGTSIGAYASERHRIKRHTGAVTALSMHKSGETCVSASRDGTLVVFHAVTGDVLRHFNGDPEPLGSEPSVSAVTLASYLHHDSAHVRKMAAAAIECCAEVGDHEALTAMASKLSHHDPSIRELVLRPVKRIILPGDPRCIAAIAGQLLVQDPEVRTDVVTALTHALNGDASEIERLIRIADAIIGTKHSNSATPCTAATEFVLDALDFLAGERLAEFLRGWDRNKSAGMQLVMLSAAVRLGGLYFRKDLVNIYGMLRHISRELRVLAGLVLAELSKEHPDKYFWEVVAHTVVEAHRPDLDSADTARMALEEVLKKHIFDVVDKAIDRHLADNEARKQADLARKSTRRRDNTRRKSTADNASAYTSSTASSRAGTGAGTRIFTPSTPEFRLRAAKES